MRRALSLLFVMMAGAAWADVPPADSIGCRDKKAGESCKRDDGSAGVCATSTCSRNDYSEGPPPKTVTYECLKCSAPPPGAAKKNGDAPGTSQSCATVPGSTLFLLACLFPLRSGRFRRR